MLHNATALALSVTANSTATLAGIEPLALQPYDGEIILPEFLGLWWIFLTMDRGCRWW